MAEAVVPDYPTSPPPGYPTAPPPASESGLSLGRIGQIAGEELGKVPGRALEDIKGAVETVRNPKMSTVLPLTLGPGAGVVPRIGAVTAGRMVDEPKTTVGENLMTAGKAAGVAALWEATLGLAPKLGMQRLGVPSLESMASRVGAFKYASEAPMKAYDLLKTRVPPGKWMFVPTINSKQAITFKEAAEKLGRLERLDYETARKEIKSELDRLDMYRAGLPGMKAKGPRPYAGSGFEARTSASRFEPSESSKAGAQVSGALQSPLSRMAADVAATEDVHGVPAGVIPFIASGDKASELYHLARRLAR